MPDLTQLAAHPELAAALAEGQRIFDALPADFVALGVLLDIVFFALIFGRKKGDAADAR